MLLAVVLELQRLSQHRFAVMQACAQATACATWRLAVASARVLLMGMCVTSSVALAFLRLAQTATVTAFVNLANAHASRAGALSQEASLWVAANIKFAHCHATMENVWKELARVFRAGQA